MRSIRLSLVVYFLALVGVALGGASLLVYRSARQTLLDKERAIGQLIDAKFHRRQDEERKRLDDGLREQALSLAGQVKFDFRWGRLSNRSLHSLGAITAATTPSGFLSVLPWIAQIQYLNPEDPRRLTFPPPLAYAIWRTTLVELAIPESELILPTNRGPGDYYQIDTNHYSKSLHSASLGEFRFPDLEGFGGDKLLHFEADDFFLAADHSVRRVCVKVSTTHRLFTRSRTGRPVPMPMPTPRNPPLYLILQVAADASKLDERLADLHEERDHELELLADETTRAMALLRNRLFTIATITFAATIIGTCWLVWLGLVPLHRLTEAVRKITPRNFTLSFEPRNLPFELRPIAGRLEETLDELRKAFAREKQATADISHELRTPLAAILTTVDLALRKPRTVEQYRELLTDCRFSVVQMRQIVERLLTLARLDAGVDRLQAQPIDVGELAEQCATGVRPLAEARGLQLAVVNQCSGTAATEASQLHTDPDKLREVLNNLLHNAIQYNRPDGRIDLVVDQNRGRVKLEVRDTGIGIAAESKDRIFERFYRADPSRTGDGMNAGLGLAIVKEYVELMGGRISVESAIDKGSTFRIELPVQAPVSAA